ncbi:hypothetical protein EC957_001769 [Mortierella hygrophila]|uniref:Uncharacterized protein n=1 Tax=Mortierella hygrophila TaxID=979708 RepID=A0A9P6F663_9FUNG|nr:hypothetical protein EC957_001769 [Mortierella hygrophila]
MGEHHNDTTNDAASSPAVVSLDKDIGDDDLTSYIGGSLSPSFKAKVMISDSSNNSNNTEDCDLDMAMEGVELEVASLTVQSTTTAVMVPQLVQQTTTNDVLAVASTSTFFPSEPSLVAAVRGVETESVREQALPLVGVTATTPTSTSATATTTTTVQTEQSELMRDTDGNTEAITPPLSQNVDTDQTNPEVEEQDDDEDDDSDEDNDDSHGLDEDPSMIVTTDAVYSAVPISSELHIFPHSSKGFNWNQDHFLKPHQRRNLGVDELHSAFNASTGGIVRSGSSSSTASSATNSSSSSTSTSNTGGGIRVHEIHLGQEETDQILPSRS